MSDRRYIILIEPTADGGYGAWAPDLPGCVALGDTTGEAVDEMRSAIAFHLEGLREDGLPIPEPSITSTVVDVAAA
jgi:predicted RNase H-like HicB family nuclease